MSKRISVVILILLILFASTNLSFAITGNEKVDWLIEKGYVQGDSTGYRLNDKITRAETTKMVVEAGGLGDFINNYKHLASMFNDVALKHWANGYINAAVINQLVNGYPDGSFKPSNDITYAEVIKMLVMASGNIPDTESYSGPFWAIPYIVKAEEVGITEGVYILDYYQPATREKVFEMVFNTMFKKEPLSIEKYKGMVVGNSRVSRLKGTKVSFVIFEDLNNSSDKKARYNVKDKIEINLPEEIEDVEYLLGKVVDISIDNNNEVTEAKLDRSYSYFDGPIMALEDEVYSGINGKYYDVYLGDRPSSRSDKILGVYHNDEEYDYEDYLYSLGGGDSKGEFSFIAEFARITVKGGTVFFIDSYTFSDIAPVGEVNRRGSEIYIYDDDDDASLTKVNLSNVIGYTANWGLETLDTGDIDVGDIIHFYNRNSAIVGKGSRDYGTFYELLEESGYYFADIDGDIYQVRVTKNKRPVYTVNGKEFKTLYAEDLDDDIFYLFDKEIKYILDINGHIQYIE